MDNRASVLLAAIDVCATDGPDAVSMRDVARRSGVSHQAPYHHFGDRSGIFAAIAEEGFGHLADAIREAATAGGDPGEVCFHAYVGLARRFPGHFRVMFRRDLCGIATHPATKAAADDAYRELERMVDHLTGGVLSSSERQTWASLVWSVAHGFATLLIDGPLTGKLDPGVSLDDHIAAVGRLVSQMFTSGLRIHPSGHPR